MTEVVVAAFLIAHGLVHPMIYVAPRNPGERVPYDPAHSWALQALHVGRRETHVAAVAVAATVAGLYTVAGLAVLLDLDIAITYTRVAAGTALALKAVWYNRWLSLGVLLDVLVVYAIAQQWPPSLY
jgi:hypothetical protein